MKNIERILGSEENYMGFLGKLFESQKKESKNERSNQKKKIIKNISKKGRNRSHDEI